MALHNYRSPIKEGLVAGGMTTALAYTMGAVAVLLL